MMPYKRLKIAKRHIDRLLSPAMNAAWRLGVRPIHLTLLSLPCGLLGVWFLYQRPFLSAFFVSAYLALDVLDGTMARATGSETKLGERLDFAFDRIVAASFLVLLQLRGDAGILPALGLALIVAVSLEDAGLIKRGA
jgi:phosphatidylglycerophosphate synthase